MKIVKIISEHKKTKHQTYLDKNQIRRVNPRRFSSRVGFVEAIVEGQNGVRYTMHMPKPKKQYGQTS